MWIIIAAVCASANINSCIPMYWKEQTFITEEYCNRRLEIVEHILPEGAIYIHGRCIAVPGQING